jgi:hypothetical protein
LEIDGTDFDNDGLIDGLDLNHDGDMKDWVGIDEDIQMPGGNLIDDELATCLSRFNCTMVVAITSCFSGGFIKDLSAPKRIIMTCSKEEKYGHVDMIKDLADALGQGQKAADTDGNGRVSIMEAFNYATNGSHEQLYDDNGDGIGHECPIPNGGDGQYGSNIYLDFTEGDQVISTSWLRFPENILMLPLFRTQGSIPKSRKDKNTAKLRMLSVGLKK